MNHVWAIKIVAITLPQISQIPADIFAKYLRESVRSA
jgi:hypothetical protein